VITTADVAAVFAVCFVVVFVASGRKPKPERIRSGVLWGLLFAAAQLTRSALDLHFGPPISTVLAIGAASIVVAAAAVLIRRLVLDEAK
jgi:heme A synthase